MIGKWRLDVLQTSDITRILTPGAARPMEPGIAKLGHILFANQNRKDHDDQTTLISSKGSQQRSVSIDNCYCFNSCQAPWRNERPKLDIRSTHRRSFPRIP